MVTVLQEKRRLKDLARYSGKWVAFIDGKVIASGETLKELMEKVRKKGLEEKVSVFLVPRKDEGPYILVVIL